MLIKLSLSAIAIALSLLPTINTAQAQTDILEWHSTNVQLLHGSGFELSKNRTQTTVTMEHVNGWAYGDNFFYIDTVIGEPDETNAELSPRLSLSKISGHDLSFGPLSDILLSGTWEKARRFDAYLYGFAVDFDVPGLSFLQTNWYRRNDPNVAGTGWQTTWVWSAPFELDGQKFTFDGYFDFANYEGGSSNFFTQPQLLWDAGYAFGAPEGKAFTGIEFRHWENKFGVDGINETAPQIMAKFVF